MPGSRVEPGIFLFDLSDSDWIIHLGHEIHGFLSGEIACLHKTLHWGNSQGFSIP
jgi:hypothetical protein